MNAIEALELSESKIPEVNDNKYNSIMGSIERAVDRGADHVILGVTPIDSKVAERLVAEGYKLCVWGGVPLMPVPTMYGVSWAKEVPKKRKWYQRIFS